jgi:hypothetical protein
LGQEVGLFFENIASKVGKNLACRVLCPSLSQWGLLCRCTKIVFGLFGSCFQSVYLGVASGLFSIPYSHLFLWHVFINLFTDFGFKKTLWDGRKQSYFD